MQYRAITDVLYAAFTVHTAYISFTVDTEYNSEHCFDIAESSPNSDNNKMPHFHPIFTMRLSLHGHGLQS